MAPLIEVFDMPVSVRFYRDVLGFRVVSTSSPEPDYAWALLERDGVQFMLNTAYDEGQRPPSPDPVRVRAHRDTTFYFGCPDVDAAWTHLREHGLSVKPPKVAPYGMKQLYVLDPDGYTNHLWDAVTMAKAMHDMPKNS